MLQSSLMVLAFAGMFDKQTRVAWQTDYVSASARAKSERKPLAVFIDRGPVSASRLVAEGTFPTSASEMLNSKFICVYIDASTEQGGKLATAFEMEQGLILSDRGGAKQALRHTGAVTTTDLNRYISEQVEFQQSVTTTVAGTTFAPAPSRRTPIRNIINAVLPDPFSPECRT